MEVKSMVQLLRRPGLLSVNQGVESVTPLGVKDTKFGVPAKVPFRPTVLARRVGVLPTLGVSVPPGGTVRAAVKWQNIGNTSHLFDIVTDYTTPGNPDDIWFWERVLDVSSRPGDTKTTNVDTSVPHDAPAGDYDAVVHVCDFNDSTGEIIKEYDKKTYSRVVTVSELVSAKIVSTVFSSI